jgi:DNA-binding transcriptional LysR family regulator
MYTIAQFDLLAALDTHRHFGRAATALGMSQPSLTKNLKSLEYTLGFPLFDRGPPIVPTPLGAIVVEGTRRMLSRFGDLNREIDLAKGLESGRLVIRSGGMVAQIAVYEALGHFSRRFPMISCDIDVIDREAVILAVRNAACDIGFADISDLGDHPDLLIENLGQRPYVMFCGAHHPLAGRADVSLADMLAFPWIGSTGNAVPLPFPVDRPMPFGSVDRKTGATRTRLRARTFPAMRSIILASDAIGSGPRILIDDDVRRGLMHVLPDTGYPGIQHRYQMLLRRGRTPSPATHAFIEELRAVKTRIAGR